MESIAPTQLYDHDGTPVVATAHEDGAAVVMPPSTTTAAHGSRDNASDEAVRDGGCAPPNIPTP
jgi:hypothetical protein